MQHAALGEYAIGEPPGIGIATGVPIVAFATPAERVVTISAAPRYVQLPSEAATNERYTQQNTERNKRFWL